MEQIAIAIFFLSIGASFVQRTTGFGFGIFIMTMLPFFVPTYGEAVTLSGILAITTSTVIVARLRKYVVWQRLWRILLTFIIVSTFAIFALTKLEDHVLRRILGVALILISLYFSFSPILESVLRNGSRREKTAQKNNPGNWIQVGAGALSGLMGGFFGMQGPPAVLYFVQSEMAGDRAKEPHAKERYMAMAQTYFLIGNCIMTIVRAYNGFFTMTVLTDYLYGIGGVAIGTWLGTAVVKHIPTNIFRYIVYGYIGISGLVILLTN